MESGLPLFIGLNGSQGSNGVDNASNRPDFSGSVSEPGTRLDFFNVSGFSNPALGAWGNLSKGAFRGPGRDNWNISMFKSFALSENHPSRRIELRVETFNTWNHTEFNGVSTGVSFSCPATNPTCGGASNITNNFGQVTSTWDPRVFQLGGKFLW